MNSSTIDHATLTHLVAVGAVRDAHVVGQQGGWALVVHDGGAERTLMAQRNRQMRVFNPGGHAKAPTSGHFKNTHLRT